VYNHTVPVCQSHKIESEVKRQDDASTSQHHSISRQFPVQEHDDNEYHCSVIHGTCTIGRVPSGRSEEEENNNVDKSINKRDNEYARKDERKDAERIANAICDAAEKLGSGYLRKIALGHLPTKVAEEAGKILDRSVRTIFEYWYRYRDVIVEKARERYLSDLKVPKSKAELFLKLPESFIRWLRSLSPWLLKRVVEHVSSDIIEQAARLFQRGRERDAVHILVKAARGEDISRIELPDSTLNTVIELGAYVDLELALRSIIELGDAFLRLLLYKTKNVSDPGTFSESVIRRVLSLTSVKDVVDLWHELRYILDMVKP